MAESIDRARDIPSDLFPENVYRVNKMDPDARSSREDFRDTLDRKEDEEAEGEPDTKPDSQPDSEAILIEDQVILSSKVKPADVQDAGSAHKTRDATSKDASEQAVKLAGAQPAADPIPADSKGPSEPDSKGHVNIVA